MRKNVTILTAFLIFFTTVGIFAEAQNNLPVLPHTLGVRQFMKYVDIYKGQVVVKGVVSQVFPKHQMLALIDIEELRECKVTTCAQLTLPVKWKGPMPEISSIIQVDGEVTSKDNRLIFQANNIKKLKGE